MTYCENLATRPFSHSLTAEFTRASESPPESVACDVQTPAFATPSSDTQARLSRAAARYHTAEFAPTRIKFLEPDSQNELPDFHRLLNAAETGDWESVKPLLPTLIASREINQAGSNGDTALIVAATHGHHEFVRGLTLAMPEPNEINKTNRNGMTALMRAAQFNHPEVVEVLASALRTPEQIQVTNRNGHSALTMAAQNGYTKVAEHLINALGPAASEDMAPLNAAAQQGHLAIVYALAKSPGTQAAIEKARPAASVALGNAIREGTLEGFRDFLNLFGSAIYSTKKIWDSMAWLQDINSLSPALSFCFDALNLSIEHNRLDVVEYLVTQQMTPTEINRADRNGLTPLMKATQRGYHDIVWVLCTALKTPETINQPNQDGMTALMFAAKNNHGFAARELAAALKTPEAINQANQDGMTALMIAAKNNAHAATWYLASALKTPEAINQTNQDGKTALMIAAKNNAYFAAWNLALALKTPEAINQVAPEGVTWLMFKAISSNRTDIVKVLIPAIEDPRKINRPLQDGSITPLMAAIRENREDIVHLLIEHLREAPEEFRRIGPRGVTAASLSETSRLSIHTKRLIASLCE